jgi:hypothetical protein
VLPVIVKPHPLLGSSCPILSTPYDGNTPSGDVLLAADHAALAFRMLLAEVSRAVPHHLGLDLKAVRRNSPVWAALQDCPQGYTMRIGLRSLYSRLDVSGDFATYTSSLGKMRRNLRHYRKKLEALGPVSVEIRELKGSQDFLPEYLALDASGWKGRAGTAIINNPDVTAFYETLISNLAVQGRWEWHVLRVRERVVAAGMGVRCETSLILPKYAFDEDFAFCSPGNLLTGEVFKDAFARAGITEINHMSLSEPDHWWRMSRDKYVDVYLVRQSVIPMLFQLPHVVMRSLFQDYVRPRIPAVIKETYRKLNRRGGRKPRRASETRSMQVTGGFILGKLTAMFELPGTILLSFA